MKIYYKILFPMVRKLIGLHRVMLYFKFHHEFDNDYLSNKNTFLHYYLNKVRVQKKLIYLMCVFHVNKSIGIQNSINLLTNNKCNKISC